MLSSDLDGEVLAAVAAIKRTLTKGGADFHDLTKAVCGGGAKTSSNHSNDNAQRNRKRYDYTPPPSDYDEEQMAKVHYCLDRKSRLRGKEIEFVEGLTAKLLQYGSLTPRMDDWLTSIAERLYQQDQRRAA
jgi:hypothetical protein